MAPLAIVFGLLLSLLGPVLFFLSDPEKQSPTAFIPSLFGVVLIGCGIAARNEKMRMHAMHAAAGVAVIGLIVPLARVIVASMQPTFVFGLAAGGSLTMAVLCGIFLALCIKSFIDARLARKKKEAETAQTPS